MDSCDLFTHISHGCFTGVGVVVRLPQCQWSHAKYMYYWMNQMVGYQDSNHSYDLCDMPNLWVVNILFCLWRILNFMIIFFFSPTIQWRPLSTVCLLVTSRKLTRSCYGHWWSQSNVRTSLKFPSAVLCQDSYSGTCISIFGIIFSKSALF